MTCAVTHFPVDSFNRVALSLFKRVWGADMAQNMAQLRLRHLPKSTRLGVTFNYDNRSAGGASGRDYVVQPGMGWQW